MNHRSKQTKAILASLIGNSIFGFSFLASKLALNRTTPVVLLTARFLIAVLILTALMMTGVITIRFRGKHLRSLILLGLFEPVIYFIFENYGVQRTSSAIGGIIISLIPIVNFFLGSFLLKENFRKIQLAWAILSVAGVCILSVNGSMEGRLDLLGLLFLFGAVFAGSVYTVLSRSCSHEFSPIERTYGMFLVGAVSFPLMGLAQMGKAFLPELCLRLQDPVFLLPVLYLSIFSSIGAYFLLNYAVTYLPVRQSTSFTSLTSVISVLAGALLLHETVSLIQLIGILMILVGVAMVNRSMSNP